MKRRSVLKTIAGYRWEFVGWMLLLDYAARSTRTTTSRPLCWWPVSRHPQHVVEAALAGGHICTMPFSIFQQLVKHPLTDLGVKKFLVDWNAQPQSS